MYLLEHKDGGYLLRDYSNADHSITIEKTSDPWAAKWFETDEAAARYMDDELENPDDWDIVKG